MFIKVSEYIQLKISVSFMFVIIVNLAWRTSVQFKNFKYLDYERKYHVNQSW